MSFAAHIYDPIKAKETVRMGQAFRLARHAAQIDTSGRKGPISDKDLEQLSQSQADLAAITARGETLGLGPSPQTARPSRTVLGVGVALVAEAVLGPVALAAEAGRAAKGIADRTSRRMAHGGYQAQSSTSFAEQSDLVRQVGRRFRYQDHPSSAPQSRGAFSRVDLSQKQFDTAVALGRDVGARIKTLLQVDQHAGFDLTGPRAMSDRRMANLRAEDAERLIRQNGYSDLGDTGNVSNSKKAIDSFTQRHHKPHPAMVPALMMH